MTGSAKALWTAGLVDEVEAWRQWFHAGAAAYAGQEFNDFQWRQDPATDLSQHQLSVWRHLKPHAPPGAAVAILDVGAGPLTALAKKSVGRRVTITAVDPLAVAYDRLLEAHGIQPPVRTGYAEAEELSAAFPLDHFDLVYCQCALDHMYDPLRALRQMLGVVKPGHVVVLLHQVDAGETEGYAGLKQWNLREEGGQVVLWNRDGRWSIDAALAAAAAVRIEGAQDPGLLLVALTKRRPGAV
jgi:SAM-dependent methyltransferase